MSPPLGFLNGQYLPVSEIAIPLDDAGFVWGATVTDRLRTFEGRIFRLQDHLSRFRQSCELARVPQPIPDADLVVATEHLVNANWTGKDLSLLWLATPGASSDRAQPTLIAHTRPIDTIRIARLHRLGAHLVTTNVVAAVDPRIKHRSRLAWWIAARQAPGVEPDTEPLFVHPQSGQLLETPTSNLLAVIDGVVTSPPSDTILTGVSLGVARELCRANAIPFVERPLFLADLIGSSEVLLTNTTYSVTGVSGLDDRAIPFPGPILNRLLDAWTNLVGVDVRSPAES
jgi:branched-chain amino acid aminotransferase